MMRSRRRNRLLALVTLVLCASAPSLHAGEPAPARAPDLPGGPDPALQRALEQLVRSEGLQRPVERGRLAIGLLDLTEPDRPRHAMVNPDRMIYAASLPKIAILFGAFRLLAEGKLTMDAEIRHDLTRMIRFSDNRCATRMLARVGRAHLIEMLSSERWRFYDEQRGGGLWVGKDYGPRPAYERDPMNNLSHGATVYQVLRFYWLLETGQLVPSPWREQMKDMLSRPGIPHKLVKGLADREIDNMYRKSGTWREYHADAAMVEAAAHRYVVAAIARHADGGEWIERLAAPLHDLVVNVNDSATVPKAAGSD